MKRKQFLHPKEPVAKLPKHKDPRWRTTATIALWKMRLPQADITFDKMFNEPYVKGAIAGWCVANKKYLQQADPKRKAVSFDSAARHFLEEPFVPCCNFFAGFAYGMKCYAGEIEGASRIAATDREAILDAMLDNDNAIDSFTSLTECHDWLVGKLGSRAGTLKRLEKICQDIGKTFAPRGRPVAR
ncbi:MAG: hypothetical protein FJ395_21785 [Verrucomicrobia bacterium]|nr:hypothetical protein [Verrucomicrobiota bacterium]